MVLSRTTVELTGYVIASLGDGRVSQTGANKALKKLVADGIVLSRPAGKSILYSLNRDHVAARSIIELSELRSAMMARIKEQVIGWEYQPVALALFGSTARGQGTSNSDIDLLLIRPDAIDQEHSVWSTQVMDLTEAVWRWSGNACQILEYAADEFAALMGTPLRDAKAHLVEAQEFLAAAESEASAERSDAATSNAVLSGINSKDAICLELTGATGKGGDHKSAVPELERAGKAAAPLAPALERLVKLKTRAQYQTTSMAKKDAESAVRWASQLYEAAEGIVNA